MIKRVFSVIFALMLLFACILPSASSRAAKTIRVGIFPFEGFHEIADDGTISGYGYDYLQAIKQYTDWEYEYVVAPWEDCLAMLADGRLDLLGSVQKTPEREQLYDFSNIQSGTSTAYLLTRPDDSRYAFEDFSAFSGMRVGLLAASSRNASLMKYCEKNHFTISTAIYKTQEELLAALESEQVDSVLFSSVYKAGTLRVIAQFKPSPFYFATGKGNTAVLDELDAAMSKIKYAEPYFDLQLYKRHYTSVVNSVPVFTNAERKYIKSVDKVRVACISANRPLEYFDEDTGEPAGILPDVFRLISVRSGLEFEFVQFSTLADAVAALKSGRVSCLCLPDRSFNLANDYNARLTRVFLEVPIVSVYSPDSSRSVTAIQYGDEFIESIAVPASDSVVARFDTIEECFEALRSHKANILFTNLYTANYHMSDSRYITLTSAEVSSTSEHICIAVSRDAPAELQLVLDKTLATISESDMSQTILSNTIVPPRGGLIGLFYSRPIESVIFVLCFLGIIIALLAFVLTAKSRHGKAIAKLLYVDALTGGASYAKFLQDAPKRISDFGNSALVYLDIQRFKFIVDTYGYETGNTVLKKLFSTISDFIQGDEIFAREHSDHFVMLLTYRQREELETRIKWLAGRLDDMTSKCPAGESYIFHAGVYLFRKNEVYDIPIAVDRANYAKDTIPYSLESKYAYYDDEMRASIAREKEIEQLMRPALFKNELVPYFQPKLNTDTNEIIGAEALIRWERPGYGPVRPNNFLPVFEHNGFIAQTDMHIFERVCATLRGWLDKGIETPPISSNFSSLHLTDNSFAEKIIRITDRYSIPHNMLEIELSERSAIENISCASIFSEHIRSAGFKFSIDDFGASYSSLNLLQRLSVDTLKLSVEFFGNGEPIKIKSDIISHLLTLAKENNITVICKGVETPAQAEYLKSLGCFLSQGYLYYKPMNSESFEALIDK